VTSVSGKSVTKVVQGGGGRCDLRVTAPLGNQQTFVVDRAVEVGPDPSETVVSDVRVPVSADLVYVTVDAVLSSGSFAPKTPPVVHAYWEDETKSKPLEVWSAPGLREGLGTWRLAVDLSQLPPPSPGSGVPRLRLELVDPVPGSSSGRVVDSVYVDLPATVGRAPGSKVSAAAQLVELSADDLHWR
jgi:hypothetical protein